MRSLRHHLRSATAEAHGRLDGALDHLDLGRPGDYGAFLVAQAAAVGPAERALEAAGVAALLPDWPARARRDALARDLALLGLAAPAPVAVAVHADPASLLGAAYVLEGSRLGAVLLRRRVEAGGDPRLAAATHHLRHGQGEGLWPGFLAVLEGSGADPRRLAQAALGVFAAFEAAFAPLAELRTRHAVTAG